MAENLRPPLATATIQTFHSEVHDLYPSSERISVSFVEIRSLAIGQSWSIISDSKEDFNWVMLLAVWLRGGREVGGSPHEVSQLNQLLSIPCTVQPRSIIHMGGALTNCHTTKTTRLWKVIYCWNIKKRKRHCQRHNGTRYSVIIGHFLTPQKRAIHGAWFN